MSENLENIELNTFEEDDSFELPPPDVIAYNELRSCADLFECMCKEFLKYSLHIKEK